MATFPYTGFPDGQSYPAIPLGTTTVTVASSAALTTALSNATPGQRIVLGSGTYSGGFALSGKVGTASSGISIEAATQGGPVFASGSTWTITNSAYVTLSGLSLPYEPTSGNMISFRGTSHHCRLTRCTIGPASLGTASTTRSVYVLVTDDAEYIRIDHNELRNKAGIGNPIIADGNASNQANKHIRIDHNLISGISPEAEEEKEPIQLGVAACSKTASNSVIERNLLADCLAGSEVISVRSSSVRVTGNTILRCVGGPVLRNGTNSILSDNYVLDNATTTTPPPGGGGGGGGGTGTQTLGVGGVATPAGAILATADKPGTALTITSGDNGKTFDGQGKKIGRVTFNGCSNVIVQNYYIQPGSQYGVVFDDASNVTLQNCDISNVKVSGDGDLNAITLWGGDGVKIKYNTAVNYVSGDPGGSHTDALQTWVSSSHPNAAKNVQLIGNKFVGPANPSRNNSIASIHQCIMVEGAGRGGNSGGSGNPSNWFVAENEFGDSWNQCVKLDGGDSFTFTRNRFNGSSDKIFDLPSASNFKAYSDNQFGSGYGSIGGTVTSGPGPATPS